MGKKKRTVADITRNRKKETSEKKTNPFEVKINRQKHDILGRKITKHERGMPGVSRSKAIKKRKETLLKDYEQQFKVNKIVDKRFGEYDSSLTKDDKMMKRYAMERAKSGVKNKYNLNEDDELTHYGQSLAEIEKFDDPVNSDDDDDDDEDRRAAAKFVAEQHFGGFLSRKTETEGDDGPKSWKERMGEMILQSKKAKHDRQVEKDETEKLTEGVDAEWKDLRLLVKPNTVKTKKKDDSEDTKPVKDDYDMMVKSLQFEIRAQATDRLKTEEEMAKEEKERLDKLEADRIRRMKGISEDSKQPKFQHKSADDLDDGFDFEDKDFEYVSYKDGKLLKEDDNEDEEKEEQEEGEEEGEDSEIEEGEDDDSENEDDKNNEDNDEVNDDVNDEDNESDEEAEDSYDDLLSDLENDDEEHTIETKETKLKSKQNKSTKKDSKTETEEMKKAKKEIPYTFTAPASYDDLLELLEGHDLEDQLTIIDRIRKCHHPSLAEENKDKLQALFGYLVQFYGDLCLQDPPQLEFVERLLKPLYEMTQMAPESSAQTIVNEIADRQAEFKEICERKGGRGLFPALDTVMLFKLVSTLFPTSDFYHHVTTPTMLFMCQILSQCSIHHSRDVVTGLLLCNLCLEYVSLSKRLVPETLNFLHGILFLSCTKEPNKYEKVVPPFKPVGKTINLLHITSPVKIEISSKWSLSKMLGPEIDEDMYNSDRFKLEAVQQCITLLEEFSLLYRSMPSYKTIFSPVIHLCKKLPTDHYPETFKKRIEYFISTCEESFKKKLPVLAMQKAKPKPLALMEPQIEEDFDGRKKYKKGSKELNEKQKLLHKYKKEMKGARRELKKDTQFIARQRLKDQMDKDKERKRKVKELLGSLANQEGEYKKMKLKKTGSFF